MNESLLNYTGMLEGLEVMTRDIEDTKLITYVATNSCVGNKLSLKDQAHEFCGNYAQSDIADTTKIGVEDLLRYNLYDTLGTFFVYEKHTPTVDLDAQREVYENLFKPAIKQILQMQLIGMPIHMPSVKKARHELVAIHDKHWAELQVTLELIGFLKFRRMEEVLEYNTTHKKKRKEESDFTDLRLNPGSPKQVAHLLHEFWSLPTLDLTDTGLPATGIQTLAKLQNHTTDPDQKKVLNALIELGKVDKILSAFIPKFLSALPVSDGTHRLYGNFNLGGTVSGRLSSSKPSLQQIPSGSKYGKLIKKCFSAPPGWILCGADYNSLEDYVSALTTKDPNKIKIYTQGFDGHSLRSFSYFGKEMPDIVDTVESINSIKKLYPHLRQASKAPTFACTYQGTWKTLVNNCGFSPEVAKEIEASYHEMYAVSDEWVQKKLAQASIDGYVTVAYGLRVRTPLLTQVVWGAPRMPHEAAAEGRTAGNALGQSYGLINTRAGIELQERTLNSTHRLDVMPCAHIHDSQYFLVRDEVGIVKWLNDNLIECMENHGLPELGWHPKIQISASTELFYPDWASPIALDYGMSHTQIYHTIKKGLL